MIETAQAAPVNASGMNGQNKKKQILTSTTNDRMAGSIPVWKPAKTPQEETLSKIAQAGQADSAFPSEKALSYQVTGPENGSNQSSEAFGFGDLIDMVNPLHHIPVVGHLYRGITGDQIHGVSKIIGGAVFGGPIGAGSSLVNVIIQEETGKDMVGNAMAMVMPDQIGQNSPNALEAASKPSFKDDPEERLSLASKALQNDQALNTLPPSVLAFADIGAAQPKQDQAVKEPQINWKGPRVEPFEQIINRYAREPITTLELSDMPR